MATATARPQPGQSPPPSRWRAPVTVLLVILAAVAGFAGAFLLTHKSKAAPPPAHTVTATITPGPTASKLSSEFPSAPIAALHKPKAKPKHKHKAKHKAKSVTPPTSSGNTGAPSTVTPIAPVETTPAYTPPPSSSGGGGSGGGGSSGGSSGGGTKTPTGGGGVITVG